MEQRLQVKQDNVDFIQAERALKRAINRLNVTQNIS
ncbi:ATP synthase delta/epsilon chain alpha-helix domain-containing protein [Ferdinandcohnia sp. SAFN-114]